MGYLKNGQVTFTYTPDSTETYPMTFSIYGDSLVYGRLMIYAPLGTTKVTGSGTFVPQWMAKNSSPEQKELNKLLKATAKSSELYNSALEERLKLYAQKIYNGPEMDSLNLISDKELVVKINAELDYLKTLKTFNAATVNQLKDIVLLGVKYDKGLEPRLEELRELFNKLTPEKQNSQVGGEIKTTLYPPKMVTIDYDLPEDTLYDINGNSHKISDFKGKFIILDFWSLGCGPCRLSAIGRATVKG